MVHSQPLINAYVSFVSFLSTNYYSLPLCDLVANVGTNSDYLSATVQRRDFGFLVKDLIFEWSE